MPSSRAHMIDRVGRAAAPPHDAEQRTRSNRPQADASERRRRLQPRLWDTDWLVLRAMKRTICALAGRVSRPGAVAIDFGCGARPYENLFTTHGVHYVGADFGDQADIPIDAAGHLAQADRSADLVLSFQVLEHVRDLDTYLSEAHRVLRDDGLMMLSTHGLWLYHPHPEDHRRWTREGLTNDLCTRGFEVIDCIPIVGPLAWTTMVRLTCAGYALRKVPLVGAHLCRLLAVVMNVRACLEDAVTPLWVTRENACVYVTLSRPRRTSRQ